MILTTIIITAIFIFSVMIAYDTGINHGRKLELIQQLSQKREKVIKVEDLEYFKKRLATSSTEAERSRIGKQLEMLEEAVVIHGIRVDIEEQKIL